MAVRVEVAYRLVNADPSQITSSMLAPGNCTKTSCRIRAGAEVMSKERGWSSSMTVDAVGATLERTGTAMAYTPIVTKVELVRRTCPGRGTTSPVGVRISLPV